MKSPEYDLFLQNKASLITLDVKVNGSIAVTIERNETADFYFLLHNLTSHQATLS